jgi:hypothetical protein
MAKELLKQWANTSNQSQRDEDEALWASDGVTKEIGIGRTNDIRQSTENAKGWKAAFPDARPPREHR